MLVVVVLKSRRVMGRPNKPEQYFPKLVREIKNNSYILFKNK